MAEEKRVKTILEPREGKRPILVMLIYGLATEVLLSPILKRLGIDYPFLRKTFLHSAVCFLLTVILYRRFLRDSLRAAVQGDRRRFWKGFFLGCVLYWIPALLVMGVGTLAPEGLIRQPHQDQLNSLGEQNLPALWIMSVCLAPVTEEVLYRGVFFSLSRDPHRAVGYVLTAALFALAHMAAYLTDMNAATFLYNLISYSIPGLALCYAYESSGNIFAAILLHFSINLVSRISAL